MRPALWFLLGFTLAVASCSAFAGKIQLNGKSSVVNGRITPNTPGGPSPSTSYTREVFDVGPADTGGNVAVYRKGLWDFTNKFGDKVSGTIIDAFNVNKSTLKDLLGATLRGGLVGVAGMYLADYLLQKGFEYIDGQLNQTRQPKIPVYFAYSGANSTYQTPRATKLDACQDFIAKFNPSYTIRSADSGGNQCAANIGAGWGYIATYNVNNSGCPYPFKDPGTQYSYCNSADGSPFKPVLVNPPQLDGLANDYVDANPTNAVKDVAKSGQPVDTTSDPSYSMSPSQVTTPERTLSTETKTNPDGSTSSSVTTGKTTFAVKPDGEISEQQENKTTTTTTDPAGHTSTSTTTTTTNGNPASNQPPEPKTLCEKTPNASACKELGEPPDLEIPTDQVELSYSWSPFSMPASCPAPRMMNLSFGTVPLEFTLVCNFAEGIRPFVLAFAFLGALYICFGVTRRE